MQVRPKHAAVDFLRRVQHVMMVVPINPHVNEAQQVTRENRGQRFRLQRAEVGTVRGMQLEHHDRNDDGDHAVTERFETVFLHAANYQRKRRLAMAD